MRTLELPAGESPREWGRIHGEMFRGETGLATDCLGDLCYHERFSGSAKFLQDSPPCFVTNGKKHLIKT